jgi:hypothetical protein
LEMLFIVFTNFQVSKMKPLQLLQKGTQKEASHTATRRPLTVKHNGRNFNRVEGQV